MTGPAKPPHLTPRELDILKLLAAGRNARQIAGRLRTTSQSVRNHWYHLYEKFDAHDLKDLLRAATDLGVIDKEMIVNRIPERIKNMELYAWIGQDDQPDRTQRTGEWGIKQGLCPAGYIPIVAVKRGKVEPFAERFEAQASAMGKKIRLVRFAYAEVIYETEAGE